MEAPVRGTTPDPSTTPAPQEDGRGEEVVAVGTDGALERVALVTSQGARRSSDEPEEVSYVWRGAPLHLRVEVDPAVEGRVVARWFDEEGRVVGESAADTEDLEPGSSTLLLEGPRTEDLAEGVYRVVVSLYHPDEGSAPPARVGLELGVGDPPAASVDRGATPAFPWPPPRPTTRHLLDDGLLAAGGAAPATLGQAADRLLAALAAAGYSEHSFYAIRPDPDRPAEGFALVTRLEQIRPDGEPLPGEERWSAELPSRRVFSLSAVLKALFTAPEGHYRVIVFTVTGRPVAPSEEEPTREEAGEWLGLGLDRLPSSLADRPWTRDHACTALIYQFRQVGAGTEPQVNPPGAPPAREQLERTGVLSALAAGGRVRP